MRPPLSLTSAGTGRGMPVEAHPESALERTWRWLEKYRTFLLLIAGYLVMRAAFAYFAQGRS
jgi:hypothetical protein